MNKKIHILGGGPAGMALAYYANKNNVPFNLFEKSNAIGGNCRTIQHNDFLFDTGAHRFHDKNSEVTNEIKYLMGDQLFKVSSPSKIFHSGEMINFPISILDIMKKIDFQTNLKIIKENIMLQFKENIIAKNFEEFAHLTYGKTLSDLFLTNYSEKLWGDKVKNLSINISGGRLRNLNLASLIKQLVFKKKKQFQNLDGDFLYPKYGFGTIFKSIHNDLNKDDLYLESDITKLIIKDNRVNSIVINDEKKIEVSRVVSTLPLPLLIRRMNLVTPTKINQIIDSFRYRAVKLTILFLNKNRFSNNASIYFPQKEIPFTRIYEPKNRSIYMAPKNKTCIVIESPYHQGEVSNKNDLEKIKLILINNGFIKDTDILDYKIIDMPYAYPILDINTKNKIEILYDYIGEIKNLYLVGRNAEFKYLHTHDLFRKAETTINKLNIN
tara:strand:- start:231 stop:1547 length:1317 start_codon:yes stop_codon:yes gene_type:complete